MVKGVNAAKERLGRTARRVAHAGQPGKNILIGNVEKRLERAEFFYLKLAELRIGETAEKQIDLAHAAMPRAEAQPLAADSQIDVSVAHRGSTK